MPLFLSSFPVRRASRAATHLWKPPEKPTIYCHEQDEWLLHLYGAFRDRVQSDQHVTPATPIPPSSIRNRHLYRRALTALPAVDILGRSRIVVGAAIRYGRVAVERRGSQADVDFIPRRSIRAAIDVIARDILGRRCLPVQVYDMVGSGLNCERVG